MTARLRGMQVISLAFLQVKVPSQSLLKVGTGRRERRFAFGVRFRTVGLQTPGADQAHKYRFAIDLGFNLLTARFFYRVAVTARTYRALELHLSRFLDHFTRFYPRP